MKKFNPKNAPRGYYAIPDSRNTCVGCTFYGRSCPLFNAKDLRCIPNQRPDKTCVVFKKNH